MPMSSPMMTTMLGRCPAGAGAGVGCCACAGLANPTAESADAATRELPLNRRSRRFNPPPVGAVLVSPLPWNLVVAHGVILFLVMHLKPTWLAEVSIGSA